MAPKILRGGGRWPKETYAAMPRPKTMYASTREDVSPEFDASPVRSFNVSATRDIAIAWANTDVRSNPDTRIVVYEMIPIAIIRIGDPVIDSLAPGKATTSTKPSTAPEGVVARSKTTAKPGTKPKAASVAAKKPINSKQKGK